MKPTSPGARVRNWDVALVMWARELVGRPFGWGETDCGTLARGALDVLYGPGACTSLLGEPHGSLRNARTSWRRLRAGWAERLGASEVPAPFARAGDLLLYSGTDEDGLPRIGVVLGRHVLRVHRDVGVHVTALPEGLEGASVWRLP